MARPPIIISNGGIAEELARGLEPATGVRGEAWEIIMRNVEGLNQRVNGKKRPYPVAMSLFEERSEARIIWRLSDEKEHPRETGAGAR